MKIPMVASEAAPFVKRAVSVMLAGVAAGIIGNQE